MQTTDARRTGAVHTRMRLWALCGITWLPLLLLLLGCLFVSLSLSGSVPSYTAAPFFGLSTLLWMLGWVIAYAVFIANPSRSMYAQSLLGRCALCSTASLCCATAACQDELPPRLPCSDSRDGGWLPACACMRCICCVACCQPAVTPAAAHAPPQSMQHLLRGTWDTDVVHMNIVAGCFHEALGERRLAIAHAGSMLCCLCIAAPATILVNLSTHAMPWSVAFLPLWLVAALSLCILPAKWSFSDESEGKLAYAAAMTCGVVPLLATLVLLAVRLDGNSQGDAIAMYWVLFPLFMIHGCGMLAILVAAVGTCVQEWSDNRRSKMVAQVSAAACAACCVLAPITATYVLTSLTADGIMAGFKPVYAFLPACVLLLCGICALLVATGAELRTRLPEWRRESDESKQKEQAARRTSQGVHGPLLLAPDAMAIAPVSTSHYMLQPSNAAVGRLVGPSDGAKAPLLSDSLYADGGWTVHSFSGRLHAASNL